MIRYAIAAAVASGVMVCGTGYAVAAQTDTAMIASHQVSHSNDGAWAQDNDSATAVRSCNDHHSGDTAADHVLVTEEDRELTVVNGSRKGCVWSENYSKTILRYRSVTMWPGPDDYGPWVTTS